MPKPSEYWASLPTQEAAKEISSRIGEYYRYITGGSLVGRLWRKAYAAKYGLGMRDASNAFGVMRGGLQGELAKWRINHWGTHASMRTTLATQQKPNWQPVPANSDSKSQALSVMGSTFLDYVYRAHRVDRRLYKAVDTLGWAGEAFSFGLWDVSAGRPVGEDPDTGQQVHEGDMVLHSLTPDRVGRDPWSQSFEACDWLSACVPANKWTLAARHPEKRDEILGASPADSSLNTTLDTTRGEMSDQVWLHHWFHRPTDAVPKGRYAILLGKTPLFDSMVWGEGEEVSDMGMPFRRIPIFRATEADWEGLPFGWTQMWNALGVQEVIDALTTAITTNQLATAVQLLVTFKDSGLNYKLLTQALAVLEVKSPQHIPQGLNLTQTKQEIFEFRKQLILELGTMTAINETAMGQSSSNIKSGQMAIVYDNAALRAANPVQAAFFQHAEDLGTFAIHCVTDFAADSERTLQIIGEHNRGLALQFKGGDLGGIERVTVEATNDASHTSSGRLIIGDKLLDSKALGQGEIAGQRYVQFIRTGQLDILTEAPQSRTMRIKQENERLAKGEAVIAHLYDPHWAEIQEHMTIIDTLAGREDAAALEALRAHVEQHRQMWAVMPPDILMLLGGQPSPLAMAPGTLPPPPGEPSGTPPPPPGGPPSITPPPAQDEELGAPMPSPPTDPQTGQPYDNTGATA